MSLVLRIDGWSGGCSGEGLPPDDDGGCPFCEVTPAPVHGGLIGPHGHERVLVTYQVLEVDPETRKAEPVHVGTVEMPHTSPTADVREACLRDADQKFGRLGLHGESEFFGAQQGRWHEWQKSRTPAS